MGGVTADLLLQAYSVGLFPMGETRDDPTLHWIDPERRTILPLNGFHLSRRLRRTVRAGVFEIRADSAFADVIRACAAPRPGHADSWINEPIIELYSQLHRRGNAHSVECWHGQQLVGGLYGVSIGAAFFGESMFSHATDASKVALVHLVARLIKGGYTLLDCQFMTEHLRRFGAVEISRAAYRKLLAKAVSASAVFYRDLGAGAGAGAGADDVVLQATTHTS